MQIEYGGNRKGLWFDTVPFGTVGKRTPEHDYYYNKEKDESRSRYDVPGGTPVIRIENDEEVPEGFIYPWHVVTK